VNKSLVFFFKSPVKHLTDYCTRTQQYNVLSEGEFNWLGLLSKYTHH